MSLLKELSLLEELYARLGKTQPGSPESLAISAEIIAALGVLPPRKPTLDELVHAALVSRPELTYRQIARALGCSKNTVTKVAKLHGLARREKKHE
jgi:hypothetical protein